jgi:hypothetical protein
MSVGLARSLASLDRFDGGSEPDIAGINMSVRHRNLRG